MRLSAFCVLASIVGLKGSPVEKALEIDSAHDGDVLSLLQVNALKHTQQDETSPAELCASGLQSGRFCCGANCGRCGGRGCQNRPGGDSSCCTNVITESGRRCVGRNMQNCLLPRQQSMGMGRGMGHGGNGPDPEIPPTDISIRQTVEELALCETTLQFTNTIQSNLGGVGPDGGDEALVFGEVAANTNLVIRATSPYTPNMLNPTGGVLRNGAREGFGVINMASGSTVDLTFTLVDAVTGAAKIVPAFVISFFDGDHGMAHESRESITINGLSSYVMSDLSTLSLDATNLEDPALAEGRGVGTFTSTLHGSKEDNPLSPLSLTTLQKQRSVTVLFENKSEFTVTLGETGYVNPQGRNMYFAGASNLICEDEAKCSTYECPFGFELKQDAEFTICDSKPCSVVDHDKCCTAA